MSVCVQKFIINDQPGVKIVTGGTVGLFGRAACIFSQCAHLSYLKRNLLCGKVDVVSTPAELITQMQGCGSLPDREFRAGTARFSKMESLPTGLNCFYLLTK